MKLLSEHYEGALASEEVMIDDALPSGRLDQLFEVQATATPYATALIHNGQSLTYRELDCRANQLAHHLRSLGAGPEITIGVCLPRSFLMVVTLLGILKAGAAYVPLDPRSPPQRIEYMLRDSAAIILITQGRLVDLEYSGLIFDLDAEADVIAKASDVQLAPLGNNASLAYVIYTSGSTGVPKGVMLTHTAVNLVAWAKKAFSAEDIARVAATTSLSFDPSILEIFAPLCLGGSIIIKDHALQPFSDDEQPTMLLGSPTVLSQLASGGRIPSSVRVINIGGEIVRSALTRELYAASKVERIYNHYGPTEATTCTTVAFISSSILDDPPIGKPIYGARVYVLDAEGKTVIAGQTGEIYIAGKNLARGYQNQPELTALRFIPDPFDVPGGRMYRTGDLGRWSDTGNLEFLGRIDDQVKLSGVRIELSEIEAALLRIDGVRQAAAAIKDDVGGTPRLVAYLETNEPLVPHDIRHALSAWLPQVMIPPSYVMLEHFPLTVSGKIDKVALLQVKQTPLSPMSQQAASSTLSATLGTLARGRPRQSTETAMAIAVQTAWRRTLPHAPLGADVSWTDAGGDSLRMLQLLLRLEQALGRKIGFDLVSSEMTQRELSESLLEDDLAYQFSPSIPVVHLIPGILGDEPDLANFRRSFNWVVRFEVIEPPELYADRVVLRSLEETGRCVAEEIARRQPKGGILLAGYSFGGAVAFEAATHLVKMGRSIALLVVLDTRISREPVTDPFAIRSHGEGDWNPWLKQLLIAWAQSDARRRALLFLVSLLGRLKMAEMRRLLLRRFRVEASHSWQPVALCVPTVIALSDEFGPWTRLQWIRLAPGATILDLPGAHTELLDPPALALLQPALLKAIFGL